MLWCVTNLHVFVSALNIHTMSSVCFVLFISTGPSSCTAGTVTLMDGRSGMEGRVEMCRGGVWGAVYGGWDFNDAKITCKQLGYPSNCELASFSWNLDSEQVHSLVWYITWSLIGVPAEMP